MKQPTVALLLLAFAGHAFGAVFQQVDSHQGVGFNKAFSYQAIPDPTNGRVDYVDATTAQSLNLTYASGDTFILRADDTTVLSASGPGRQSVRLQSNIQYSNHVAVFSLRHMPQGCGTWPAIWEVGENWPSGGEIDIVEGVNDQGTDRVTLHTSPGCSIPSSGVDQSGTTASTDCDASVDSNTGCGVQVQDSTSFGPSFNDNGGGWYAMERTDTEFKVWFWSRSSGSVPADVESGSTSIDTDTWNQPVAYFPDTDCDIDSHFGPNNIIINLTFCGDWAGSAYSSSGCPSDCVDYVNNNPSAFSEAYFDIQWLKIYQ